MNSEETEISTFIPRHAEDQERLERLRDLPLAERVPLLSRLLEWVKEENQPIAAEMVSLLLPCGYELVPHLKMILQADDPKWKGSVMRRLLAPLPKDVLMELVPELIALAMNPTENDLEAEVDELAEELLSTLLGGP
jgi:hypothetical protein